MQFRCVLPATEEKSDWIKIPDKPSRFLVFRAYS